MLWVLGYVCVQVLEFHLQVLKFTMGDLGASGWAIREPKQFVDEGEGAPGAQGILLGWGRASAAVPARGTER